MRSAKRQFFWIRSTLAAAPLLIANVCVADIAPAYTLTKLGTPGSVFNAAGMNNAGDVVGVRDTGGPNPRIQIYRQGLYLDIGPADWTPTAISDSGIVIGTRRVNATQTDSVRWENGVLTTIDSRPGRHSEAIDVNSTGQVLLRSYESGGMYETKIVSGAERVQIPGMIGTSINDSGVVVGGSDPRYWGYYVPLVWSGSNLFFPSISVGLPPGVSAVEIQGTAWRVSNAGRMTGVLSVSASNGFTYPFGFLVSAFPGSTDPDYVLPWEYPGSINDSGDSLGRGEGGELIFFAASGGRYSNPQQLSPSNWVGDEGYFEFSPSDFNNRGQILALGFLCSDLADCSNSAHESFIFTPAIPEPSTYAMLLLGLGVCWVGAKRARGLAN